MVQGEVDRGGASSIRRKPAATALANVLGPAIELARYLAEVLEQRRRDPRDDLLSALLAAEIDGQRLSELELIGFGFLLLVAGNETTTNLISNAAILLDRRRDQRRLLTQDPARIPGAIEEFLRYDSPVQGLARTTTAPMTLHGVTIPEGSKVLLLFGSANRDERKIHEAERFDVLRDPNPHLAFGFGAHFCLGANLARLEARVAFEELLARLPDYRMTESRVQRHLLGSDPRRAEPADRGTLTSGAGAGRRYGICLPETLSTLRPLKPEPVAKVVNAPLELQLSGLPETATLIELPTSGGTSGLA